MSLMEVSLLTGVPVADLESLIRGNIPESVAEQLGVPLLGLEDFILRGYSSAKVAHRLGISMSAAEELATGVGQQGAVGIIIGVLLISQRHRTAEAGR
jgi:hypothetical protein